ERVNKLILRRDVIGREIFNLEEASITAAQPNTAISLVKTADQLLLGEDAPNPRLPDGERLFVLLAERKELDKAIHRGNAMLVNHELEAAAEIVAEHRDRWAAITRRRIDALLDLAKANSDAVAFKEEMRDASGLGLTWPCDPGFSLM